MAERTLSATRYDGRAIRARGRVLALGLLIGTVAGMGSFMSIKHSFMPWGVSGTWAFVLIGLSGAYVHFLSRSLSESIALSLVAFAVGVAVHVGAWIAPLWTIPYPPIARDLLLPRMLGRALTGNIFTYVITFYASYFGAVLVGGYLDA